LVGSKLGNWTYEISKGNSVDEASYRSSILELFVPPTPTDEFFLTNPDIVPFSV